MLRNRNLLIIALIAIVNALGYGIIIPVLYSYSRSFGLSDFQNGLLFSTFSIFQFLSTPVIGRLSDRYGRRPLLLISLLGTTFSFLMMAFARSPLWLFAARTIDGATAGNISVASAVISDTTEPKDRARGFGIIGASFGLGFVFGPAISGLTYEIHHFLPFTVAAVISLISLIATYIFLPETNKFTSEVSHKKFFDFGHLIESLFDAKVGLTLLISFLYSFAFSVLIFAYQPFGIKILGMNIKTISAVFSGIGIVGVVSQMLLIPIVSKKYKDLSITRFTLFGNAFMFFLMAFSKSQLMYGLVTMGMALFNAFVNPMLSTLLSKEVDSKSQGSIMGVSSSYVGLGSIFGPIAGGAIASFSLSAPFMLISAVVFSCFLLSLRIKFSLGHPDHAF